MYREIPPGDKVLIKVLRAFLRGRTARGRKIALQLEEGSCGGIDVTFSRA